MTTEHEIQDYFIAVWPEGVPVDDPDTLNSLMATAIEYVWKQYLRPPKDIRFEKVAWLFTDDADEVERTQPAHDCSQCRDGNRQAQEYLRDNPGRLLALGDLKYVEIWP